MSRKTMELNEDIADDAVVVTMSSNGSSIKFDDEDPVTKKDVENVVKTMLKTELSPIRDTLKKITSMLQNLDNKIEVLQESTNALFKTSPLACLEMMGNTPVILSPKFNIREEATWTIVKSKDRYFALGLRYFASYYKLQSPNLSFVSLPEEVVKSKVLRVGTMGDPNASVSAYDAVVVEMACCPAGVDPDDVTDYSCAGNDTQFSSHSFSVGISESRPVVEKSPVQNGRNNRVVFVESSKQPVAKGTLMFIPNESTPVGLQILGIHCGRASGTTSRGEVTPLPKSIEHDFNYDSVVISKESSFELTVCNPHVSRQGYVEGVHVPGGGVSHYTLTGRFGKVHGVLIQKSLH